MKTKILIGLILLSLVIGVAVATDINNLKVPEGWESIGSGSYHQVGLSPGSGNGHNMMIEKWLDSFREEYYVNHSDDDYFMKDYGNNTFVYVYGEDTGCFEVVEIDGVKYFVNFWYTHGEDIDEAAKTYEYMLEFNELNGLKPVSV